MRTQADNHDLQRHALAFLPQARLISAKGRNYRRVLAKNGGASGEEGMRAAVARHPARVH